MSVMIIVRSALHFGAHEIDLSVPSPSSPSPRIIITFCDGEMAGGTRLMSTGSLTLDFLASRKIYRLKLD